MAYEQEISRRKTFAIISHPDAGKTTLTEKLLLFGGQIQSAGAVKSNKITKAATSARVLMSQASSSVASPLSLLISIRAHLVWQPMQFLPS